MMSDSTSMSPMVRTELRHSVDAVAELGVAEVETRLGLIFPLRGRFVPVRCPDASLVSDSLHLQVRNLPR